MDENDYDKEEDDICSEEELDDNFDFADYYSTNEFDYECAQLNKDKEEDPEYFDYNCLTKQQTQDYINKLVDEICNHIQVSYSIGKVLLHSNEWNVKQVIDLYKQDKNRLFKLANLSTDLLNLNNNNPNLENNNTTILSNDSSAVTHTSIINHRTSSSSIRPHRSSIICQICFSNCPFEKCSSLCCGHLFCIDCWQSHLEISIKSGLSIRIQCMEQNCFTKVTEEFVYTILQSTSNDNIRKKFDDYSFNEYVASNPLLRHCPGVNCTIVFQAKQNLAHKVKCNQCSASMCFKCKLDYHAPTDCKTIKKWLTKCADDSETANYISVNTKDCPKCHICIEKNGGCNHMQCTGCKHNFCWICLNDWVTHGTEYYECSRFKGNTKPKESDDEHVKAREALKKYLFYYERWENHARSLRLEEQTLEKIKARVQERVMQSSSTGSTWIDWQYLLDAAALLAKCRYTLQYTYPYVYYMETGPRKQLFEYQQAQLESEIEALSWAVERAETYDRGEMENQMNVAEKRRSILLKDFLPE